WSSHTSSIHTGKHPPPSLPTYPFIHRCNLCPPDHTSVHHSLLLSLRARAEACLRRAFSHSDSPKVSVLLRLTGSRSDRS
ncbi:Hypothetical predicted protein, partial [Xyrichtys novacula]